MRNHKSNIKKEEDQIKSKTLLDLLIETSQIMKNGVMWINADGHILGLNDRLIEELGYKRGQYAPKTIFEVNPNTSFLSWKKLWQQALQNKTFEAKTEQLTADSSIYPVNMKGVLVNLNGVDICMVITENLMTSNRYKNLLDITSEIVNIGSWEWDLVQDEILVSNQMYNLLGVPRSETITRKSVAKLFRKMLSEDDYKSIADDLRGLIAVGGQQEREISLNINGLYNTYKISVKSDYLEGETIKLYGTIQNFAKINKKVSSLFFTQYVMDNARDIVIILDENNAIIYANKSACKTLGYSKEEMIGKLPHFINPHYEDDKVEHWDNLEKTLSVESKAILRKKDGTLFPVSVIANHLEYEGKSYICGFSRDLTKEHKRNEIIAIIENSLNQSRDLFCSLLEDGSFNYFNQTFLQLTGYSEIELHKMTIFDLITDQSVEMFNDRWKELRKGEKVLDHKRELTVKSGKIIPVDVSMDLVEIEGSVYSTLVMRDVTTKLEIEKERKNYLMQIEALQKNTAEQNIELKAVIDREINFSNIITRDPNYKKVLQQVDQVSETDATVLILGETGTGKELLANAVHTLSERSNLPMVKINCGALPENLIESELFGHEKGSFTGAHKQKIGKFERADKGTIFLDEIGELSLDLQSKLLRVLQEGEIERVGGTELIKLDVRVIAATNRNLEKRVNEGKFREDLYYRLNVFPIYNLALRERPEDIPVLAQHFVKKHSKKLGKKITKISTSSLNKLTNYSFLGNVRELENIVERAVILCNSNVLSFDSQLLRSENVAKSKRFLTLEEAQKYHIIKALKRTKGKVSGASGAAKLLEINGKTLASRISKLNISKKDYL